MLKTDVLRGPRCANVLETSWMGAVENALKLVRNRKPLSKGKNGELFPQREAWRNPPAPQAGDRGVRTAAGRGAAPSV